MNRNPASTAQTAVRLLTGAAALVNNPDSPLNTALKLAAAYKTVRGAAGLIKPLLVVGGLVRALSPRRVHRSALGTVGMLTAAAAVGAGVALLATPNTGAELREKLLGLFRGERSPQPLRAAAGA